MYGCEWGGGDVWGGGGEIGGGVLVVRIIECL